MILRFIINRTGNTNEELMSKTGCNMLGWKLTILVAAATSMLIAVGPAMAQRVLGVDISYWNRGSSSGTTDGISQSAWNTAYNTPDQNGNTRQFVVIRASRGGTTGTNVSSGTPGNPSTPATLSQRYDDPDFQRNITRAANAGMIAGPYHFGRPEVSGNTGTDEANHFMEAAGAWMRPGYMMPMYDMESGSGSDALAQFVVDFSNRLNAVMGIRPSMYINGNYSSILQGASASLRNQLAQPVANTPSMVGPAYPMLWDARYSDNSSSAANYAIPVQTGSPKTTYTTISSYYGPWDDYGNSAPWGMWQYGSVQSVPGFNTVDSNVDGDVSHGDIEYVKDMMVPAVWWNNSNGNWGTMTNWNSGQPLGNHAAGDPFPTAPYVAPGQYPPMSGGVLPVPRLPGTAGSGPAITSGVNDTIILERPSANITVTLDSGAYNIRKLYMREALAITGGSLTINYDPLYNFNVGNANALRSGPISAQFSGPVTMSGSAALTVHTLQVDAAQTFTVAGGTLTINTINLKPSSTSPAKKLVSGNLTINPLNNGNPRNSLTAVIANGSGSGNTGFVDLGGGMRDFAIGNGSADIDVSVNVPISNGSLTKSGPGTLRLTAADNLGQVVVNAGTLLFNSPNTTGSLTINAGTLGGTGSVSGAVTINSGAHLAPGASIESLDIGALTLNGGSVLDIELASAGAHDLVNVSGLLDLTGGSVHVFDFGGMTAGTYTIIDYGTRTGSVAALGTPTGPAGFVYSLVDTGSVINLVVAIPEPGTVSLFVIGLSMLPIAWRRRRQRR
jgi:autotransporter-associated beta strand protein